MVRWIWVLATGLLLLLPPAWAQGGSAAKAGLAVCAAQSDLGERVKCLDRLAAAAVAQERERGVRPSAAARPPSGAAPSRRASIYEEFVSRAKANIVGELDDPLAVQWRNLFVSGRKRPALCGELSDRDRRGAYGGYRRFLATTEPSLQELEDPKQPFLFARLWEAMCNEPLERVE